MAEDEKPKLTMKADSAKIRVEELAEPVDRAQEICTQIKNNVYNVPHYNQGNIEVIDVIEDWDLGFHEGNIIKYVARAKHKGEELEDLEKAKWYLERLIEKVKSG